MEAERQMNYVLVTDSSAFGAETYEDEDLQTRYYQVMPDLKGLSPFEVYRQVQMFY